MSAPGPTGPRQTRDERRAAGEAARTAVPAASLGTWTPAADRPDPIACSRSRRRPGSPSSSRSATAGWRSRRSRSSAAPRCRWPPTSRPVRRTGIDGPALRRRPPRQLRAVRVARARPPVRHQRLRRDAARPVRVRREAPRREPRRRRPRRAASASHDSRHVVHRAVRSYATGWPATPRCGRSTSTTRSVDATGDPARTSTSTRAR